VNWLTLLGDSFLSDPETDASIAALREDNTISVHSQAHGIILQAGPQPEAGDANRLHPGLDPYFKIANALRSRYVTDHPDFYGEGFVQNRNTLGWIRRFIEPAGWR
jgi:hypothetical protein